MSDGLATARQKLSAEPQIARGVGIIGQGFNSGRFDDTANADLDRFPAFVQQLIRQCRGTQPRMHHPQHLERQTIGAMNQDGQRLCLRDANQPRGGHVPFGIADGALFQIEMRNLTGGENQQKSARPQMLDG